MFVYEKESNTDKSNSLGTGEKGSLREHGENCILVAQK